MSEFKVGDRVRVKMDQTHLASDWPGYEGILAAPNPDWDERCDFHWEITGAKGRLAVYNHEIEKLND